LAFTRGETQAAMRRAIAGFEGRCRIDNVESTIGIGTKADELNGWSGLFVTDEVLRTVFGQPLRALGQGLATVRATKKRPGLPLVCQWTLV